MEASRVCSLLLLFITAATYGLPTTSNPQEGHDSHVLHEPRGQSPHIPPLHEAVGDKPAQPHGPRDSSVGSIPCTSDINCTTSVMGKDSLCRGNLCSCTPDTVLSDVSQQCLHESSLGSGCDEDWQCTRSGGTSVACKNHICTCNPDAAQVNGRCWKQKYLSDSCEVNEECIGGHDSSCEDGRCTCKPGMLPKSTNDKCLKEAQQLKDPCEEAIQCTEPFGSGSACNNGQCTCQDNYRFVNHKCMKNLIVGEKCGVGIDGQCFLLHGMGIDQVDCISGSCQCKDDLTPSSDNQKCLSPGQKDPGSGGGAENVQPLLITFVTILFARLLSS